MTIETHGELSERAAEVLQELIDSGKLSGFVAMIEGGLSAWQCIGMLEEELLACERASRDCGATDRWRIVVGLADDVASVPGYQGWGDVQSWLEREGVCAAVEPPYGVVLWECGEFDDRHSAVTLATSPFAEDSAIRLNAALQTLRDLEDAFADD